MVVDGIAQLVPELGESEGLQVGVDAEAADVVVGDAMGGGVVVAQIDGIRGVGVDDDEGVEGPAAGEEGGRRQKQQGKKNRAPPAAK